MPDEGGLKYLIQIGATIDQDSWTGLASKIRSRTQSLSTTVPIKVRAVPEVEVAAFKRDFQKLLNTKGPENKGYKYAVKLHFVYDAREMVAFNNLTTKYLRSLTNFSKRIDEAGLSNTFDRIKDRAKGLEGAFLPLTTAPVKQTQDLAKAVDQLAKAYERLANGMAATKARGVPKNWPFPPTPSTGGKKGPSQQPPPEEGGSPAVRKTPPRRPSGGGKAGKVTETRIIDGVEREVTVTRLPATKAEIPKPTESIKEAVEISKTLKQGINPLATAAAIRQALLSGRVMDLKQAYKEAGVERPANQKDQMRMLKDIVKQALAGKGLSEDARSIYESIPLKAAFPYFSNIGETPQSKKGELNYAPFPYGIKGSAFSPTIGIGAGTQEPRLFAELIQSLAASYRSQGAFANRNLSGLMKPQSGVIITPDATGEGSYTAPAPGNKRKMVIGQTGNTVVDIYQLYHELTHNALGKVAVNPGTGRGLFKETMSNDMIAELIGFSQTLGLGKKRGIPVSEMRAGLFEGLSQGGYYSKWFGGKKGMGNALTQDMDVFRRAGVDLTAIDLTDWRSFSKFLEALRKVAPQLSFVKQRMNPEGLKNVLGMYPAISKQLGLDSSVLTPKGRESMLGKLSTSLSPNDLRSLAMQAQAAEAQARGSSVVTPLRAKMTPDNKAAQAATAKMQADAERENRKRTEQAKRDAAYQATIFGRMGVPSPDKPRANFGPGGLFNIGRVLPNLQAANNGFSRLGLTFDRLASYSMVGGGMYGFINMLQRMGQAAVSTDKMMKTLNKTLQLNDEQLLLVKDSLMGVSVEMGQSFENIGKAGEEWAKQGYRGEGLTAKTRQSAMLMNISGMNPEDTVRTLAAAIKQFNLTEAESASLMDKWTRLAETQRVEIKDLADGFAKVGGLAKNAGWDLNSFNALLAATTSIAGDTGTNVGNAFRSIMSRLENPNTQVKAAYSSIGMDVSKYIGDMPALLEDLSKKWNGLTAAEKQNIAQASAEKRRAATFFSMMTAYQSATGYQKAYQDAMNSEGAAVSANQKVMASFSKQMEVLNAAFAEFAASIADTGVLAAVQGLVKGMTTMLDVYSALPAPMRAVFNWIGLLSAATLSLVGTLRLAGVGIGMNTESLFRHAAANQADASATAANAAVQAGEGATLAFGRTAGASAEALALARAQRARAIAGGAGVPKVLVDAAGSPIATKTAATKTTEAVSSALAVQTWGEVGKKITAKFSGSGGAVKSLLSSIVTGLGSLLKWIGSALMFGKGLLAGALGWIGVGLVAIAATQAIISKRAEGLRKEVSKYDSQEKTLTRYEYLRQKKTVTGLTSAEKDEFVKVGGALASAFPTAVSSVNKFTGEIELATITMREMIQADREKITGDNSLEWKRNQGSYLLYADRLFNKKTLSYQYYTNLNGKQYDKDLRAMVEQDKAYGKGGDIAARGKAIKNASTILSDLATSNPEVYKKLIESASKSGWQGLFKGDIASNVMGRPVSSAAEERTLAPLRNLQSLVMGAEGTTPVWISESLDQWTKQQGKGLFGTGNMADLTNSLGAFGIKLIEVGSASAAAAKGTADMSDALETYLTAVTTADDNIKSLKGLTVSDTGSPQAVGLAGSLMGLNRSIVGQNVNSMLSGFNGSIPELQKRISEFKKTTQVDVSGWDARDYVNKGNIEKKVRAEGNAIATEITLAVSKIIEAWKVSVEMAKQVAAATTEALLGGSWSQNLNYSTFGTRFGSGDATAARDSQRKVAEAQTAAAEKAVANGDRAGAQAAYEQAVQALANMQSAEDALAEKEQETQQEEQDRMDKERELREQQKRYREAYYGALKEYLDFLKATEQASLPQVYSLLQQLKKEAKTPQEKLAIEQELFQARKEVLDSRFNGAQGWLQHMTALERVSIPTQIKVWQQVLSLAKKTNNTEWTWKAEEELYNLQKKKGEEAQKELAKNIFSRAAGKGGPLSIGIAEYRSAMGTGSTEQLPDEVKDSGDILKQFSSYMTKEFGGMTDDVTGKVGNLYEKMKGYAASVVGLMKSEDAQNSVTKKLTATKKTNSAAAQALKGRLDILGKRVDTLQTPISTLATNLQNLLKPLDGVNVLFGVMGETVAPMSAAASQALTANKKFGFNASLLDQKYTDGQSNTFPFYTQVQGDLSAALKDVSKVMGGNAYWNNFTQSQVTALYIASKNGWLSMGANANPGGGGSMRIPVPGGTYSDTWGAPRSGGRQHKGTDIFAKKGTSVLATHAGIARLGYGGLGGNAVYVTNPKTGMKTYYAHLNSQKIANGKAVRQGQIIGTVGNTGNAAGGADHLHFQYDPTGGGWVNPYPYLQSLNASINGAKVSKPSGKGWSTAYASTFGGPGDEQAVAGPYPRTDVMNARGPMYYAEGWDHYPTFTEEWPFGTKAEFSYKGKAIKAILADRGPSIPGRMFDLGHNTAQALGFPGLGYINWRLAYHSGGLPGSDDSFAAILKRGEMVVPSNETPYMLGFLQKLDSMRNPQITNEQGSLQLNLTLNMADGTQRIFNEVVGITDTQISLERFLG